jgi:FkbM family methyltransferase
VDQIFAARFAFSQTPAGLQPIPPLTTEGGDRAQIPLSQFCEMGFLRLGSRRLPLFWFWFRMQQTKSVPVAPAVGLKQAMNVKTLIKRICFSMGYEVRRASGAVGQDAFRDMGRLTKASRRPVIIDAGANIGQSISQFRSHFDHPNIHAFEPSCAFSELQRLTTGIPDLHLNNFALGSVSGEMDLIENEYSTLSSLLEPSIDCFGATKGRHNVAVSTLDNYCAERSLTQIDILKSDTQGFDLEVIKGAAQLLMRRRIHLVYMEINFSNMYKDLPRLDEIYGFMADHGFCLVSFYRFYYQHDRAAWTDALFVDPEFEEAV